MERRSSKSNAFTRNQLEQMNEIIWKLERAWFSKHRLVLAKALKGYLRMRSCLVDTKFAIWHMKHYLENKFFGADE